MSELFKKRQFWQSLGQFILFVAQGLFVIGALPNWEQVYLVVLGSIIGMGGVFGLSRIPTGNPPPPKVS